MKLHYKSSTYYKRRLQGPMFILPVVLVLIVVVSYPLVYGFYISLFDTNLVNKWEFVGFQFYGDVVTDADFYESLWVTLRFTCLVILGHFGVGMVLATIMNRKFPGRLLFRTILLLPWVLPDVSIALVWKWILNPVYGVVNNFLLDQGLISKSIEWFSNPTLAFSVIVFICIWKGYPLVMLLVLAGLQSISPTLYEAARIDGANSWQVQRYIVFPSLKPVLLSSLILDTVWWFKHYTIVWLVTTGGPNGATNLISVDIFKQAFDYQRFGRAAAMAVLVFVICFVIGYLQRKVLER